MGRAGDGTAFLFVLGKLAVHEPIHLLHAFHGGLEVHGPAPQGGEVREGGAAVVQIEILALVIMPPLWLWVIRPLRHMVGVANRLGAGELDTPVEVRRSDELGDLERAFEGLRVRIQQQLAARERLLTDISHELRGPLARMALALPLARRRADAGPYLDEVERVAGRILLLHEGRVRLDVDKQQLLDGGHGLLLEWPEQVPEGFEALLGQLQLNADALPTGLRIDNLDSQQLLAITQFIAAQPTPPSLLRFGRPSLEQLYLSLNGGRL